MKFIRIVDWDKYQHYKKRKPPWIKLYTDLLRDYRFEQLHNDSMLLSIMLCLLASQMDNKIPADEKYIQKHLPIHGKLKLQPLIDAGFIVCYQDDSTLQAGCKQDAIPETETENRDKDRGRFAPPTAQEVTAYAKTINYTLDGQLFVDSYASKGWKVGRSAMKDWKAAVRTWKNRDKQTAGANKTTLYPIAGKTCSIEGCSMPAVYKDTSGAYDHYKCTKHLPDAVRAKYG